MVKRKPAAAASPSATDIDPEVVTAAAAIAAAKETVVSLERKLGTARANLTELAELRRSLAFAAHAESDEEAQRQLAQLHHDVATQVSVVASIEAALEEARAHVPAAEAAWTRAIERRDVANTRAKLAEYRELSIGLDKLTAEFFDRIGDSLTRIAEIASIGPRTPRGEIIAVMSDLAIRSAAMKWRNILHMDAVPPGNQCTFEGNFTTWARQVEKWCTDREAA